MKKFMSVLMFLIFCSIVLSPLVKAQNYNGPVFRQVIPENRESRSLDFRHDSVKWGGKKLVWVSAFRFRFRGSYSKRNPRFILSTKTTRLISNNKARKRH